MKLGDRDVKNLGRRRDGRQRVRVNGIVLRDMDWVRQSGSINLMLRKSVSVTDADIQNILRNGNWVGNDGLGLSRSGRWIIVVTGKR